MDFEHVLAKMKAGIINIMIPCSAERRSIDVLGSRGISDTKVAITEVAISIIKKIAANIHNLVPRDISTTDEFSF